MLHALNGRQFRKNIFYLAMVGSTICTLEELFDMENNMAGRSQWILNPRQPPGLWHELVDFMRESVLPHRNKLLSSNQRGTKRVISVFKCWFPILCWCQNYDRKTFKNDLIAGLTLASLCIPQVIKHKPMTTLGIATFCILNMWQFYICRAWDMLLWPILNHNMVYISQSSTTYFYDLMVINSVN